MTVINNATLILKDSQGNKGIVKSFTDNDINKISNAITDVGQVVDPATHMPIEATKTSAGVVQLATAQDITNGTAGKVVDAQELNNFAQTLPAANGVTDVSSGDNSNQLVVSRIGGSKTLTIDNVEHAGNADEATHASQADTATSANSVAWDNVSGKSTTLSGYGITDAYTKTQVDKKVSDLVNSAPETLDTLNELANALGNDPNFATTIANQIGTKANDSNVVHKNGNEIISGTKTFNSDIYSVGSHHLFFRHLDGSTDSGADGDLFLNYGSSRNVYFNSYAYYINGGYYNGTSEKAKSADSVAWNNVSGKPSSYTPSSHTHDDRYYTESEIDIKLNGKSNTNHTHSNYLTGITKAMVTNALGYTPPTTNTTYSAGTGLALNGTSFNVTLPRVAKDSKSIPGVNKVIFEEYSAGTNYNLPSNAWYHIITMEGSDANYATQLALGMTVTAAYYRCYNSKTWSDWKSIINTNTWNALKGSTTSAAGTAGYAPAPAAGAANRYLRCDGTWQVPPDNNTTYSVATTSANGLMSSSDKTKLDKCVTTDSIWIG